MIQSYWYPRLIKPLALAAVAVLLALSACGAPTPTEPPAATAAPPTAVPLTATALPTSTPAPTEAPRQIDAATVADLREISVITASDSPLVAAALAPDTHNVATYDADRRMRLWDADSGQPLVDIGQHTAEGFGLGYSPDGKLIASGGGFEVTIWDAATGKQVASVTTNVFIFRLVWSADSKFVAVVGDSSSHIPIIDVASATVVNLLDTPAEQVLWSAAFSPDGTMLAAGDYEGQITVIKLADKSIVANSREAFGQVWDLEFSPDGSLLLSCNAGGNLYAWDTATWTLNQTMTKTDVHANQASCADGVFTPDSSLYFSAGLDGRLIAWEVATGNQLAELDFGVPIWTVSLSGDDTRMALALDNGQLRLLGLNPGGAQVSAPPPTEIPEEIIDLDDVPHYPGIIKTVATDALDVPKKCGGTIFRHSDVYYSIDYGAELSREEKKASPLNQQILDFYKQQFAAQDWLEFHVEQSTNAVLESVFWEEENRSYPAGSADPPYVGSCYLVTILIQPPGADLEIIADVD